MKRAVGEFAGFSDERLFTEVAEGIPFIAGNAVGLDEAAGHLHEKGDHRVSEVIRGFAEEEAAKVLILIDLVRCPRHWEQRGEIAKRFYGHVAKRIYAMTCSYPRIASFKDLCGLVEAELQPYYLDGPNWVDWVFPNSIAAEREQNLYVDYVRDITVDTGDAHWRTPSVPVFDPVRYEPPNCVTLCRALSEAGASSAEGLAVIARIWRGFEPAPDTGRKELWDLIEATLQGFSEAGLNGLDEALRDFVFERWPFPLWSLTMKEPREKEKLATLKDLREERESAVEWIEKTEANRDTPPAISRPKVEALSAAYAAWMADARERGLRSGPATKIVKMFELPSYKNLQNLYGELTEDERASLLALAWFTRDSVADWPRIYAYARERVGSTDDSYDIGLGNDWLAGMDRWEAAPQPFEAGRRFLR